MRLAGTSLSKNGRVPEQQFRYVAHARFGSIHDAGEGLADDGVVGLLASLRVTKHCFAHVGLVMPTRQVPLQDQHEALVRVVSLQARR